MAFNSHSRISSKKNTCLKVVKIFSFAGHIKNESNPTFCLNELLIYLEALPI